MNRRPSPFYTVNVDCFLFTVLRRYTNLRVIGTGASSVVCFAHDNLSGRDVAIKKLMKPFDDASLAKRTYREFTLMKGVNHKYVTKMRKAFTPQNSLEEFKELYIVMDLMDTHLGQHKFQDLKMEQVSLLVYKILCGTKHLHSAGIVHRDLKPSNIALKQGFQLKIIDLGLARVVSRGTTDEAFSMTHHIITRAYRAPEVFLNLPYTPNDDDTWKKIFEVLDPPSEDFLDRLHPVYLNHVGTLPLSSRRPFTELFPDAGFPLSETSQEHYKPDSARDLLHKMLVIDPSCRISIDDALRHPFIKPNWKRSEVNAPAATPYDVSFEKGNRSVQELKAMVYRELQAMRMPQQHKQSSTRK